MITAANQNRSYYPALDGLRGVAILLVLFYHNFGFINYFFFGWLGVDLFFVLSGFLITDILLKTRNTPGYFRNFYMRRVLRIFPLYYLALFIFLVAFPLLGIGSLNLNYYIDHYPWLLTYLQNWLYIFNPAPVGTVALTHFWSLAVEEQFYLVWPFIILVLKKPGSIIALLMAMLIGVITLRFVLWNYQIEDLAYFNLYTFTRIDGICIGSMLAVLRITKPNTINKYFTLVILGLAALNFIFYFFNKENQFSYPYLAIAGYTTFAILFGLLVNESMRSENRTMIQILSSPWLRFLGTISYGLYVFHWPVHLLFAGKLSEVFSPLLGQQGAAIIGAIITSVFAIVLAYLSYRFYEMRFLSLKKKFA